MTDGFETIGMIMVYGAQKDKVWERLVPVKEIEIRIKVQILFNQLHGGYSVSG